MIAKRGKRATFDQESGDFERDENIQRVGAQCSLQTKLLSWQFFYIFKLDILINHKHGSNYCRNYCILTAGQIKQFI